MSGKLLVLIYISSLLVIRPISTASSRFVSCEQSLDKFNVKIGNSAAYISVPFHYQSKSYYCGPAALEMVFDYYGEDVPQAEIADVARTYPFVTYTDELRRAAHFSNLSTSLGDEMSSNITGYSARKVGYAAFEQCGLTIDDLKTLINKGEPVIVLMWWTPSKIYGHYRVVIGYNETQIIMHDPYYANKSMTYQTFLDFWECSGNWGLWVRPWNIELQMPGTVNKEESFEVIANITYPCSTPFDAGEYPASYCRATIKLQEGLELALGETAQHSLGNITAGNSVQTSWSIHANETSFHNISVTVTGIVEGNVGYNEKYYNYEDAIGGSCTNLLSITNETYRVHNIHTGLNYTTIQTAIDAPETLDGHRIFVEAGTYYENVVVEKSLTLVGENRNTTIIDGSRAGQVVDIYADNTVVEAFMVRNGVNGVWVEEHVFNVSILGNIVISNQLSGILLDDFSHDNNVIGNIVAMNSGIGMNILSSYNNTLRDNDIRDNNFNFSIHSFSLSAYIQDIDSSNTVDGKPIYYLVSQSNQQIPIDAGCVVIVNSTEVTVRDVNLSKNFRAVMLAYSHHCVTEKVNATSNYAGIRVEYSNNNTINGNILVANNVGVSLENSGGNTISKNMITNNSFGISMGDRLTTDNQIIGNTMTNNSCGIYIAAAVSHNRIYHNNFVNNTHQVWSYKFVSNTWNNGYPLGGNYWSNYTGVDFSSGSYQNETGSDGIGDTAQVIDEINQDNYPLIGMLSDFNATLEHHVQAVCNSTITGLKFNGTAICFNVTGKDGTVGFCRTCIPTALMNDTYTVFVNGTKVSHDLLPCSNSTHSYLYFTYPHSTQEVVIVPEFLSFLLLPLFMISTLLAVIVYRRKHSQTFVNEISC